MTPEQTSAMIKKVVEGIFNDFPEVLERYGETGKKRTWEDNEHHFKHLETALYMNDQKFFTDYALWLNNILTKRGMKTSLLIDNFERIEQEIKEENIQKKDEYLQLLELAIHSLQEQAELQ
ncbi:hypothetical protein [Heyndrickxia acidicola]|uniref:Uncharacterized protein n=1 Tax=Heyndrickxia acidicola TaxID=209389 RepID=A0ABU6MG26_9BACI|nr:hypothetical protein [Heyndrickxia acidicola]MED1203364.1 hypothetical protein [Heyndrickxia acidicola]